MRLALELAARGRGRVSPNPMVGAVLVKANRVVGKGFHRRCGGPHAEVEAIRDAGVAARGSTLYVTMEPCCFCGKTPACTDAIPLAGIKRVHAATLDPHRRVNGRGVRCLRGAGIPSAVGLLGRGARRLNEAYFTFHRRHRPFVVLKLAATLDGMLATTLGESQWITGPKARSRAQELRCNADALLVGVNTVLADDPRLTCRVMPGKRLLRVVLDSWLRTPLDCRIGASRGPVVLFTSSRNRCRAAAFTDVGFEVIQVDRGADGHLSWTGILAELHRRQVLSVLVEGGATVASSALEAGIVDKLYVTHAPKVLGPGRLFSQGLASRSLGAAIRLRSVSHEELGDDVMTSGYVVRS